MGEEYVTDLQAGKKLEVIWINAGLKEISIVKRLEEDGKIQFRRNWCVQEIDPLGLQITLEYHDTALAADLGQANTSDLVKCLHFCPQMRQDVDQFEWKHHSCQLSHSSHDCMFWVLWHLPVPDWPAEDISMDFIVRLLECEKFDWIWLAVDRLLKMWHFIPVHATIDVLGLAEVSLQEIVCFHGLPLTIVSDCGPQFASVFWK